MGIARNERLGESRNIVAALHPSYELTTDSWLRRLVDLLAREARGRGIAAHDRLALLERQHVVDAAEAVGGARLDRVDHALGPAGAVHPHDLRGHRQALLLVHPERVRGMLGAAQPVGEAAG